MQLNYVINVFKKYKNVENHINIIDRAQIYVAIFFQ